MAWSKTGLHFPEKTTTKRCSQTKHRGRAAWVFSTFTLQVLTALLQQWSAFLDFSGDGLLYDGKSGLFWTKYQNVFMNNHIKVHASKCLQFGFFQSLIMIITSIAWKGNVGSLVMSSSQRHASSASCSWITAKGTEKMSIERDSAWRVKCYSAMMSLQLICKQANKLKV